jgi:hypothetical protein
MRVSSLLLLASAAIGFVASHAGAQVYTQSVYYAPQPTTYVQPTTFIQPAPTVIAPTAAAPAVTYVQPTTVYRPVLGSTTAATVAPSQPVLRSTYYAPQPVYAPQQMVVARPVVSAPVQVVSPTPVYSTRYRPILGGTVTRAWYP